MKFNLLNSPVNFLKHYLAQFDHEKSLKDYESWWEKEGKAISTSVDRNGTPWVKTHSRSGERIDQILYPQEYRKMLYKGYKSGVIWRAFEENSVVPHYLFGYVTSFFDSGLYCPYTVSMGTSVPVFKYADDETKSKYLPKLTAKDDTVWQGATWMTEIKGGSDLGNNIKTTAVKDGNSWKLTGDKYFCSNAGSELAVVAARPENVEKGVKGIALFLVPRYRENGKLNYTIRRLKDKIATRSVPTGEVDLRDSDAFLLGNQELGIYVIMEVLNISRVANSVGSVALAQRAISEAFNFAKNRRAFGKPIIEHSLLNKQFEERYRQLQNTFSLAWEAVRLLDEVWNEKPPYSDRYHLFRLIAHLAKYWTAEFAVDTAKWAMEVHGGLGTLQEYPVERWLREAMILSIWEGTSHRQILDGLAVMEKKNVHRVLAESLSTYGNKTCLTEVCNSIDHILSLQKDEKEASAENVFREFAKVVSISLFEKYKN